MRPRIRRTNRRGQTLVEFALIVPFFLLVLFGILDLGRGVLAYNSISNGAREGARLAIVDQTVSDIRTRVVEKTTGVAINPASDVRIRFRQTSATTLTLCSPAAVGCTAEVTVRTFFQPATPVIGSIIGTICLQSTAMMPIEHIPNPQPPAPSAWTAPCP